MSNMQMMFKWWLELLFPVFDEQVKWACKQVEFKVKRIRKHTILWILWENSVKRLQIWVNGYEERKENHMPNKTDDPGDRRERDAKDAKQKNRNLKAPLISQAQRTQVKEEERPEIALSAVPATEERRKKSNLCMWIGMKWIKKGLVREREIEWEKWLRKQKNKKRTKMWQQQFRNSVEMSRNRYTNNDERIEFNWTVNLHWWC